MAWVASVKGCGRKQMPGAGTAVPDGRIGVVSSPQA